MAVVTELNPARGEIITTQANSWVEYVVTGQERLMVQLYGGDTWPSAAVITPECLIGRGPFVPFPTPIAGYTSFGMKSEITVRGIDRVRFRLSTVSSTDMRILLAVNGVKGLIVQE